MWASWFQVQPALKASPLMFKTLRGLACARPSLLPCGETRGGGESLPELMLGKTKTAQVK